MTKNLQRKYELFVAEYLSNGMNATKAYHYINPNVKQSTAEVNGCKLLKVAKVNELIDIETGKRRQLKRFSKQSQLERVDEIVEIAKKKDKLSTSLQGLEIINKMQGYYDNTGKGGEVDKFLQALQINVNVENKVEK